MKFSKKSIVAITVLLILALSTIGNTMFLASADVGGTGKYLEMVFEPADVRSSGCFVTATKVDSDQVFLFNATDYPDSLQKVGAGTVLLEAIPSEGWVFDHFGGAVTRIDGTTAWYKTVKYGEVTAVFKKQTYTITVNVTSEDPDDYVETTIGNTPYTIHAADGLVDVTGVIAGDTPVFDFEPETGNHVSVFQVNGEFKPSATEYAFKPVYANQQITVYFSPDGQAYIPPEASGVPISLGNNVNLNFSSIQTGGTANQAEINFTGSFSLLNETSLILWNVSVDGVEFKGSIIVALPYNATINGNVTSVFTSNDLNALYCDVDGDGSVTNADVNLVAIALATNGREYDPDYDVNRDLVLNSADIQLVHDYLGTRLESLNFSYDEELGILYVETGHFTIFRGR